MNPFRRLFSVDYMGHKKWWFTFSAVLIAAGLVSLFVRGGGNPVHGLRYGLEFKEGTRIAVAFRQPATVADVREVVARFGYETAQIQETANVAGSGRRGFQIQVPTLEPAQQAELKKALDEAFGIAVADGSPVFALQTVGATFGRQVVDASLKAAVLAIALILAYVTLRFRWKFAVGAIAAVFHDLLVVVGVYSIVDREVTTATIAAVLTILGYSLYDTVIVYDRIRENEPKLGRLTYGEVVNISIWETLTRSVNTTLTTLLPVLCLLFFGGPTLQDFAFALLVGIVSGAYSSIFVASPVVTVLRELEPQYRKLKAARAGQA